MNESEFMRIDESSFGALSWHDCHIRIAHGELLPMPRTL